MKKNPKTQTPKTQTPKTQTPKTLKPSNPQTPNSHISTFNLHVEHRRISAGDAFTQTRTIVGRLGLNKGWPEQDWPQWDWPKLKKRSAPVRSLHRVSCSPLTPAAHPEIWEFARGLWCIARRGSLKQVLLSVRWVQTGTLFPLLTLLLRAANFRSVRALLSGLLDVRILLFHHVSKKTSSFRGCIRVTDQASV